MDIAIDGIVALLVAFVAIKVAWFTVKKVAMNLIVGYATFWVLTELFHVHVGMGFISWTLTALLGPIPVLIMALF